MFDTRTLLKYYKRNGGAAGPCGEFIRLGGVGLAAVVNIRTPVYTGLVCVCVLYAIITTPPPPIRFE